MFVELLDFICGGGAGQVVVHGGVHAVGHDEGFGEQDAPWFHGVILTEVVLLDGGVGMVGYGVAFGPVDASLFDFLLDFGGQNEGRRLGGTSGGVIFADDSCALGHVVGD